MNRAAPIAALDVWHRADGHFFLYASGASLIAAPMPK